jgi:multidrug efflux pump subunit AcrA (membrane-fusion protein)
VALLLLTAAGRIGWLRWYQSQPQLLAGIACGNGRLEADEIDIDTKFAGRIVQLFVDEGDLVKVGPEVAMIDTQDLAASLKKFEALVSQVSVLDEAPPPARDPGQAYSGPSSASTLSTELRAQVSHHLIAGQRKPSFASNPAGG